MFGLRTWAPMASRGSTSTTVYCTANLCASRQLIVEKKKDYARERWRTLCKSANLQTPGSEGNVHAGLCLPLLRPLLLAARELCSTPTAQVHHIYAHNPAQELSHYSSHYCLLYTILSMGWWQHIFVEFCEAENLTINTFLYAKMCCNIQLNLALKHLSNNVKGN